MAHEYGDDSRGLIMTMLKQVRPGMELSKLVFPTFVLFPTSLLEQMSVWISYPELFIAALEQDDPLDRFLSIVRWFVSGWSVRPKVCKKPYNPVLGEYFFGVVPSTVGRIDSDTYYFAEQVSHHPPISALLIVNVKYNIVLECDFKPKSRFSGNSVTSEMEGTVRLHLRSRGETYRMNLPHACVRNVMIGRMFYEYAGKVRIHCAQTGLSADLDFHAKPMLRGAPDRFSGTVYKGVSMKKKDAFTPLKLLSGLWSTNISIEDWARGKRESYEPGKDATVFYTPNSTTAVEVQVDALEEQGRWESRRLWSTLTEAISSRNSEGASVAKKKVEDEQRALRSKREEKQETWVPKYFIEDSDGDWHLMGIEKEAADLVKTIQAMVASERSAPLINPAAAAVATDGAEDEVEAVESGATPSSGA